MVRLLLLDGCFVSFPSQWLGLNVSRNGYDISTTAVVLKENTWTENNNLGLEEIYGLMVSKSKSHKAGN